VGIEPPEPAEVGGDGFDDAAAFAGRKIPAMREFTAEHDVDGITGGD